MKLTRAEWCALVAGVLMALGFFAHQWYYPSSLYDAGQYTRMARDIAEHGLFARFSASALRTYGYPVLLSFVHRGAAASGIPIPVLLFAVQFSLYLAACFFFRQTLFRISPLAARIAFCGMLANYYILIYTPESLTESLSISLLIIAAACWLVAYREHAIVWPVVVGTLVSGFSLMVRPANLFFAVAWIFGIVLIGFRSQRPRARVLVGVTCVTAALALPLLPQLAYNVLRFGRWTPFLAQNLGQMQMAWGIKDIKYATAMAPIHEPAIHYINPLWAGTTLDEAAPWKWYVEYPGRGLLTLALHTFNLTDQDLLFTYSRDLHPWYRVPLGVINHGAVVLGLAGLVFGVRAARSAARPDTRDAYSMLVVTAAGSWAMHVWTAVEMRFGFALLLVLVPLAGYAIKRLASRRSATLIGAALIGVSVYVVLALMLSSWVREQAPLIRAARSTPASLPDAPAPDISVPAAPSSPTAP